MYDLQLSDGNLHFYIRIYAFVFFFFNVTRPLFSACSRLIFIPTVKKINFFFFVRFARLC